MLKTHTTTKIKPVNEKTDYIDQILKNIDINLDKKEIVNNSHVIKNVYIVKSFGKRSVLVSSNQIEHKNRIKEIEHVKSAMQQDNKDPIGEKRQIKDLQEIQTEQEVNLDINKPEYFPSYKSIPKPYSNFEEDNKNYEFNKIYQQEFKINSKNSLSKTESPRLITIEELTDKIGSIVNDHIERFNSLKSSYHNEINKLLMNHNSVFKRLSIKNDESDSLGPILKASQNLNNYLNANFTNCLQSINNSINAESSLSLDTDFEKIEKNMTTNKMNGTSIKKKFSFRCCLSPIDEWLEEKSTKSIC